MAVPCAIRACCWKSVRANGNSPLDGGPSATREVAEEWTATATVAAHGSARSRSQTLKMPARDASGRGGVGDDPTVPRKHRLEVAALERIDDVLSGSHEGQAGGDHLCGDARNVSRRLVCLV